MSVKDCQRNKRTIDYVVEAQGEGGGCKIPIRGAGGLFAGCAVAFKGNTLSGKNNFPTRIGQRGYQKSKLRSTKNQVSDLPATLRTKISLAKQEQFVLRRTDRQIKDLLETKLPDFDIPQINITNLSQELITLSQEFSPANRAEAVARFLAQNPDLGVFNVNVDDFRGITDQNLPNSVLAANEDLIKIFETLTTKAKEDFAGDFQALELAKALDFSSADIELNYVTREIAGIRSRMLESLSKRNSTDALNKIESNVTIQNSEFEDSVTNRLVELYQVLPNADFSVSILSEGGNPTVFKQDDVYIINTGELLNEGVLLNSALNGDSGYDAVSDFLYHAYGHIHEDSADTDSAVALGYRSKTEVDQSVYPFENSEIASRILRHQHEYLGRQYAADQSEVTAFAFSTLSSPKKLFDADTELVATALATLDTGIPESDSPESKNVIAEVTAEDISSPETFLDLVDRNARRLQNSTQQIADLGLSEKSQSYLTTKETLDAASASDSELQQLNNFLVASTSLEDSIQIQDRINQTLSRKFPDEYVAYVAAKKAYQEASITSQKYHVEIQNLEKTNTQLGQYVIDSRFTPEQRLALINNLTEANKYIPSYIDELLLKVVPGGNTPSIRKLDEGAYELTPGNFSLAHTRYSVTEAVFDASPVPKFIEQEQQNRFGGYCSVGGVSESERVLEATKAERCAKSYEESFKKGQATSLNHKLRADAIDSTPEQYLQLLGLQTLPETFRTSRSNKEKNFFLAALEDRVAQSFPNVGSFTISKENTPELASAYASPEQYADVKRKWNLDVDRVAGTDGLPIYLPNTKIGIANRIDEKNVAVASLVQVGSADEVVLQDVYSKFLRRELTDSARQNLQEAFIRDVEFPFSETYAQLSKVVPVLPDKTIGTSIKLNTKDGNLFTDKNLRRMIEDEDFGSFIQTSLLFGNIRFESGNLNPVAYYDSGTGVKGISGVLEGSGFRSFRVKNPTEEQTQRIEAKVQEILKRKIEKGQPIEGKIYKKIEKVPKKRIEKIRSKVRNQEAPDLVGALGRKLTEKLKLQKSTMNLGQEALQGFFTTVQDRISIIPREDGTVPRTELINSVSEDYEISLRKLIKDGLIEETLGFDSEQINNFVSVAKQTLETDYDSYLTQLEVSLDLVTERISDKFVVQRMRDAQKEFEKQEKAKNAAILAAVKAGTGQGKGSTNAGIITEDFAVSVFDGVVPYSQEVIDKVIELRETKSLTAEEEKLISKLNKLSEDVPKTLSNILGLSNSEEYLSLIAKNNIGATTGSIPISPANPASVNEWLLSQNEVNLSKLTKVIDNIDVFFGSGFDSLDQNVKDLYVEEYKRVGDFVKNFRGKNDSISVGIENFKGGDIISKGVNGTVTDVTFRANIALKEGIEDLNISPGETVPVISWLDDNSFVIQTNNKATKKQDSNDSLVKITVSQDNIQAEPYQISVATYKGNEVNFESTNKITQPSKEERDNFVGAYLSLKTNSTKLREASIVGNIDGIVPGISKEEAKAIDSGQEAAHLNALNTVHKELNDFLNGTIESTQFFTIPNNKKEEFKNNLNSLLKNEPLESVDPALVATYVRKAGNKTGLQKVVNQATRDLIAQANSKYILDTLIDLNNQNRLDLISTRGLLLGNSLPHLKFEVGLSEGFITPKWNTGDSFVPDLTRIDERPIDPKVPDEDFSHITKQAKTVLQENPSQVVEGLKNLIKEIDNFIDPSLEKSLNSSKDTNTVSPEILKAFDDIVEEASLSVKTRQKLYSLLYKPHFAHVDKRGELILSLRNLGSSSGGVINDGNALTFKVHPGGQNSVYGSKIRVPRAFSVTFADNYENKIPQGFSNGFVKESALIMWMYNYASENTFEEFVQEGDYSFKAASKLLSEEVDFSQFKSSSIYSWV